MGGGGIREVIVFERSRWGYEGDADPGDVCKDEGVD